MSSDMYSSRAKANSETPQVNTSVSSSVKENKTSSGPQSNSTSSNVKSAEKSISSEGIVTGTKPAEYAERANNLIGIESHGVVGSVKDATASSRVDEFLEPEGTVITKAEAQGLENLLRKALRFLPEQRLAPSELAKHHWYFDAFEAKEDREVEAKR